MLAALAVAALVIGGVSSAVVVTHDDQMAAQRQTPVVEVQKVETVNPFTK
jgi:hypothetical protein